MATDGNLDLVGLIMARAARRAQHSARRFLRTRAVLAGALVLGVGGSLTLASWTDNEYAQGSFATSTFVIESNTAAVASWAAHESGSPATMTFAATAMSPGTSFYAFMDIRTTAATNVAGTAALSGVFSATGALLSALEYRVAATTTGTTCASAVFGAATYSTGITAGGSVPTVAGSVALGTASTTPVRFCFDVRVKAGTATTFQGTTATIVWQFTGTSNS